MPCLLFDGQRDFEALVHGEQGELEWSEAELRKSRVLKRYALLGPDSTDDEYVTFIDKRVSWGRTAEGQERVDWEADPRHDDILLREPSLNGVGAKAVSSPVKDNRVLDESQLEGRAAKCFHSSACTENSLNFVAQDSNRLQYRAKESARHVWAATEETPMRGGQQHLAHTVQSVVQQEPVSHRTVYTDSDWAGDELASKSTCQTESCAIDVLLRPESRERRSMTRDLGQQLQLIVQNDSTAAKGMDSRRGVRKVRHLHTQTTWVQQRVFRRNLMVQKIARPANGADLCTTSSTSSDMLRLFAMRDIDFRTGRHQLTLHAAKAWAATAAACGDSAD